MEIILMNRILIFVCLFCLSFCTAKQSPKKADDTIRLDKTTSIYFVRHAEKEKNKDNPSLTEEGKTRANRLAKMLQDIPLSAIYSSDYKRTKETAEPSANQQNLEITLYNPSDLESTAQNLIANNEGKNVLVVGHSNTTPALINIMSPSQKAAPIEESEYDNLYILNINTFGTTNLIQLRY